MIVDIESDKLNFKDLPNMKKPVNTVHGLLCFKNKFGLRFAYRLFKNDARAGTCILKPELISVLEMVEIASFCNVNPLWLFLKTQSEYLERKAQVEESKEKLIKYHKQIYAISRLTSTFKELNDKDATEEEAEALLKQLGMSPNF
jgi:hypothetical protein